MPAPVTHLQEAQKLTADGEVDLFEIRLKGSATIIRFKNDDSATWQGMTFDSWPCQLAGDVRTADEEEPRPTFTLANPEAVFQKSVFTGALENATVVRYRLLRTHLIANLNIFQQRMWYVGRVGSLVRGRAVTLNLRNMTEGPNFLLPVRMYMPPEFPTVSL